MNIQKFLKSRTNTIEKHEICSKVTKTFMLISKMLSCFTTNFEHSHTSQPTFTCSTIGTPNQCVKCLKLTIKAPERRQWHRCGVFIANLQQIFIFYFILFYLFFSFSHIVDFEKVNTSCVSSTVFILLYRLWTFFRLLDYLQNDLLIHCHDFCLIQIARFSYNVYTLNKS